MRVMIIASRPKYDQDGISHLLGQVYQVNGKRCPKTKQASVTSRKFGGLITLNSDEYRVTRRKVTEDNQ